MFGEPQPRLIHQFRAATALHAESGSKRVHEFDGSMDRLLETAALSWSLTTVGQDQVVGQVSIQADRDRLSLDWGGVEHKISPYLQPIGDPRQAAQRRKGGDSKSALQDAERHV